MAVPYSTEPYVVYFLDPDAPQTEYAIPFTFMDAADILCVRQAADGTEDSLSGTIIGGNGGTGTITFSAAPAVTTGDTLTIYRRTPLSQTLDLSYNEGLTLELLERALDKLTRAAQEIKHGQSAVRFPESEPSVSSAVLPTTPDRISTVMYFNAYGTLELVPIATFKSMLDALP